jgi:hypothetical protein
MVPEISRVETRYEMNRRDREVAEQLLENARYDAAMDRQVLYSSEVEQIGTKEYRHNQIVEQIRQLRIPIDDFFRFEELYEKLEEEDASDGNFMRDLEGEYQMRKREMLAAEQQIAELEIQLSQYEGRKGRKSNGRKGRKSNGRKGRKGRKSNGRKGRKRSQ